MSVYWFRELRRRIEESKPPDFGSFQPSAKIHTYTYTLHDLGRDYNGFNLVYASGGTVTQTNHILRILTDVGLVGEYAGGSAADYALLPSFVHYLIGKHALERERSAALIQPLANQRTCVVVRGAARLSKFAALVEPMCALVLLLVRPEIDVVAATTRALGNDSIEHRSADALAPSVGKHVDQAQEQRAWNHITCSITRPERLDEYHRNGLATITTDQKPRSGGTELSGYLSNAGWPRWPYTATACKVRALIDRYRRVNIIVTADLNSDLCHADPKRVQQRED